MSVNVRRSVPPHPLALILALSAAALSASAASAQSSQPTESEAVDSRSAGAPPPPNIDGLIDSTRVTVRSSVEWLASGVDSWFGDIPFSKGGKVSDGELSLTMYKRQDQPATTGLRFKARFRLPNLESYQYIFVGNDDRSQIASDRPDTFSRQQQLLRGSNRDNAFFAGIGASLRDLVDLRLGLRGGLTPYAQARYQKAWQLSTMGRIDFRETLFYTSDDKLGSTTALSYEHPLTSTLVARWLNSATVTRAAKDVTWSSSLGTYKSYGGQRLLSVEALFGGIIGDPVTVTDYGLQAKWSQPIHKDFLIGEFILGTFWPRPDLTLARKQAWAVGTGIKLRF